MGRNGFRHPCDPIGVRSRSGSASTARQRSNTPPLDRELHATAAGAHARFVASGLETEAHNGRRRQGVTVAQRGEPGRGFLLLATSRALSPLPVRPALPRQRYSARTRPTLSRPFRSRSPERSSSTVSDCRVALRAHPEAGVFRPPVKPPAHGPTNIPSGAFSALCGRDDRRGHKRQPCASEEYGYPMCEPPRR